MASKTTYFIVGANRGIGKGFVAAYLSRPDTTVIAGVRTVASPTSASLKDLPKAAGSILHLVEIDTSSNESILAAVNTIKTEHNISKLDVVVNNAGIFNGIAPLLSVEMEVLRSLIEVNGLGPFQVFRATLPLLQAAPAPKFIVISSNAGSAKDMPTINAVGAYGASKALSNYLTRWLSSEVEDVIICSLHPGEVITDMVGTAVAGDKEIAARFNLITVEKSVSGMTEIIDNAEEKKINGRFLTYNGEEVAF